MRPVLLFPIAMLTPFLLTAVLLVPAYAGILGATYIVYLPESGVHPLADRLMDVFYILDVYGKMFDYWLQHLQAVSLTGYTLPLLGLPLLGGVVALYATYRFVRMMLNFFHLSASV